MSEIAIKILERAIALSRGDSSYQVDERLHPLSIASITFRRAMSVARGSLKQHLLKECGSPLFVGRHVSIYHPGHISIGSGCSLNDYSMIDGLSSDGIIIGNNVTIERYVSIRATGTLRSLGVGVRIGDNSSLGSFSYLGAAGGVTIGDNVRIGSLVSVYAENHEFDDLEILIKDEGVRRSGLRIGRNCWSGYGF